MGGQSSGSQTRLWYQKGRVYARLAVCMWASVSVRRAALCAASVSSWGGTVRKARVLHVGCRLANTARLRATSFAWGLRRPAICGGLSWSRRHFCLEYAGGFFLGYHKTTDRDVLTYRP